VDPITTISGPVDANAFIDNTSIASGESTLAEVVQVINKVNEVIGGLVQVAGEVSAEEAARVAADAVGDVADAALDARLDTAEGYITLLQTGFSDHASLIQGLESRVSDLEYVTAAGYVEVPSGILTLAVDTNHVINFTGTSGLQSLELPTTMTDFSLGQHWTVVCNNADGLQISSSAWAHSSLTGGVANLNLLVGDMAIVSAVDVGTTKKWSAAVLRGHGGLRAAAAGVGDLGAVDQDDRSIWVDRTADTGTRDLYLPELGFPTLYTNGEREITVILHGTPTSGTFVVNCQGTDVFIDGATTFTMTEKSVCRFIGNDASKKWAAIVGGAM
jgi:hypothetical protein